MPPAARVFFDAEPRTGAWNMAIDEALLESAVKEGVATLRFYRWSEPTLSLGYFQQRDETLIPKPLRALPIVRRLSGGGAIVHHREWTYSCAVPARMPLAKKPGELYKLMHGAIIDVLRRHGIDATLRGKTSKEENKNFLCFARGDANDVVLAGHKIVGSAQRRRRGAILQHGSLLWRVSEYAPELPGVSDLVEEPADTPEVLFELAEGMGSLLAKRLFDTELTEEEMERAAEIVSGQ